MTAPAAVRSRLSAAERDPAGLPDDGYVELLGADGDELEALCALADGLRRDTVGDALSVVVNRNLSPDLVHDPEHLDALVDEAWQLGATEICVQGPVPVDAGPDAALELVRRITARQPLHLHAFRPAEVAQAAERSGRTPKDFLTAARDAGLGSVPGTAARILDDDVRRLLTDGADIPAARWIELVTTAHEVGLRSTATIVYGHVETPAQQVAHLRALAAIQDRTGGFTELIAMPLVDVPESLVGRVRGASPRETRALHAVARLLLHGRIDHVQAAWPKLDRGVVLDILRGGADDLGGLLLDGTLDPAAGAEAGRMLGVDDVTAIAAELDRPLRQRTTLYGDVPAERVTVGRSP
ncbi:FO synthase [Actinomycetospora endophytica]|uniref:FO synthase n=1 Tax=Actinomycetospora endophytica TaxID=2291215 RepID=A0ABS8P386_9PSEU|nr:FO synthase [Actinomycetospora endophytica]MCD2192427.1 FO synthase [Actinomycetospora endophytica]